MNGSVIYPIKRLYEREDILTCLLYKYAFVVQEMPHTLGEKMNHNLHTIISQTNNLEIIKFVSRISKLSNKVDVHYAIQTTEIEKEAFLYA